MRIARIITISIPNLFISGLFSNINTAGEVNKVNSINV